MSAMALEGIRVVDFSWVLAGPALTRYLADYGAEVIKIESTIHPDITRTSPPYRDGKAGLNRSVGDLARARDLKTYAALAQAKEALIAYAVTYADDPTHAIPVPGFLPCPS